MNFCRESELLTFLRLRVPFRAELGMMDEEFWKVHEWEQ